MEPQNIVSSSSYHHPLLPTNFVSTVSSFPVQFSDSNLGPTTPTTSNSITENVSSPLFMSTLQQLSGLSNANFLPSNSQINSTIENQFSAADIANLNSQSVWFDQAKMAAMLPMYFQSTTSSSFSINSNNQHHSQLLTDDQTLKNQTTSITGIPSQSIFWNNKNFYSNEFESVVNDKGNHAQSITGNLDNMNSDVGSPSLFINAKAVQQQHPVNRMAQQSKFQNIHHSNSSHQSPLSNSVPSVGSPANNVNRIIPMHHSSYPPSKSSLSSSNEGMIESPLSTYSNLTQHHHSHETAVDVCSNSPFNYQNSFISQQINYEQNPSITKASPNQIKMSPSPSKLKRQPVNLNTFNQLTFDNNNPNFINFPPALSQNSTFQPLPCNNNHFTNDSTKQNQQLINNETNISYSSNSTTTNDRHLNENVEDLSVLDLNDFEDFLNDKDAVSTALTIDPTTIFNSVQSENSTNSNQINLASNSTSTSKSILDSRKSSSLSVSNTSLITSAKMRERIHERRAEELANVDKELDRLVSLVARQNDAKNIQNYSKLNNSFLNDVFNSMKQQPLTTKLNENELNLSQTMLQPVQFTPPDSPTNLESDSMSINFATKNLGFNFIDSIKPLSKLNSPSSQTASITSQKFSNNTLTDSTTSTKSSNYIVDDKTKQSNNNNNSFKSQQQRQQQPITIPNSNNLIKPTIKSFNAKTSFSSIKYNRVPIYKQQFQKSIFPLRESIVSTVTKSQSENNTLSNITTNNKYKFSISKKVSIDDAYSFTDDDDEVEETAIPKSVVSSVSTISTTMASDSGNFPKVKIKKFYEQNKQIQNPLGGETSSIAEGSVRNSMAKKRKCANPTLNSAKKAPTKILLSTPLSLNQKIESLPLSTDKPSIQSSSLADIICQRRINNCNIEKFEFSAEDNDSFLPDNYDNLKNTYKFSDNDDFSTIGENNYSIATCKIKVEDRENNNNLEKGVEEEKYLPKLIIKFNKPELYDSEIFLLNNFKNEYKHKLKKKKKRKKKDKNREWGENSQQQNHTVGNSHRKKHKKHKKEKRSYYSNDKNNFQSFTFARKNLDQGSISSNNDMTPISDDLNKINQQLPCSSSECMEYSANTSNSSQSIDNLLLEENNLEKHISVKEFLKNSKQLSLVNTPSVSIKNRLKSLLTANGTLPKGTFLIAKDDAFKIECSLWKIDNQNLLQKYFPISVKDNEVEEIHYKNSSTYSGWCDKIADDYVVVEVIFIKQSRAENIVKPSVPICDLFPSVTKSITGNICSILNEEKSNNSDSNDDSSNSGSKNDLKEHLRVFVKALLKHAISLNFLQIVKTSNDWNYLCAFNEIEKQISETMTRLITRVKWTKRFKSALNFYTQYFIFKICDTPDLCQACGACDFSMSIYFYSIEICNDSDLIKITDENDFESKAVLKYMICNGCERLVMLYHKNQHMKYHLFKKCEDKLEMVSHEFNNFTSDLLIEQCMNQKSWLQNIVTEYIELWKKCLH